MCISEEGNDEQIRLRVSVGLAVTRDAFTIERITAFHRQNFLRIRKRLQHLSRIHDLELTTTDCASGLYQGSAEPSYIFQVCGTKTAVYGFLGESGKGYAQECVIASYPAKAAIGFRYYIDIRPPITAATAPDFFTHLQQAGLVGSSIFNSRDDIKQIQYWGSNPSEDINADRLYTTVRKLLPDRRLQSRHEDGWHVEFIEKQDYDTYIRASAPGRMVETGEYVSDYL